MGSENKIGFIILLLFYPDLSDSRTGFPDFQISNFTLLFIIVGTNRLGFRNRLNENIISFIKGKMQKSGTYYLLIIFLNPDIRESGPEIWKNLVKSGQISRYQVKSSENPN